MILILSQYKLLYLLILSQAYIVILSMGNIEDGFMCFSMMFPGITEALKQVWDLSDQDNDSMLSLREFCIAVYLMERYREGRPLPPVFPSTIILSESMFTPPGQSVAPHGNASWGHQQGIIASQKHFSVLLALFF